MYIEKTSLKEDIEERFLEDVQEEIGETSREDLEISSVMRKIIEEYDYEKMEEYIREHIDSFEIEEVDQLIEQLSIFIVEEELPQVEDDLLNETRSIVEEYIEQKYNSFEDNYYDVI